MTTEQDLLQRAAVEISQLRRTNEILQAKVSTFESVMLVFRTEPNSQSQGMSPDVVWEINKHLSTQNQTV